MTEEEFKRLGNQGFNRVPLSYQAIADLDTPLSAYLKLADRPGTFLLESVVGGERFGRYSYIGLVARTSIRASGNRVCVLRDGLVVEERDANPLDFAQAFVKRFHAAAVPGLPHFGGGLVGYLGYDAVRWIEPRLSPGWDKPDVLGCPDMLLLLCEELAVFDNLTGKLHLIVYADPAEPGSFKAAELRLRELRGALRLPLEQAPDRAAVKGELRCNFTEQGFKDAVLKAKRYIEDGDIMQVVLSQRFSCEFGGSPMAVYRALRAINPSPYMFYFNFGSFHVVGASPEILVRLEGDTVTVRPIAGTRPRGKDAADDKRLEQELLADPKECAEHVMLLDLGRNDVGRVAAVGSVKVTEQMAIERYSHVMHIVSHVEGRRRDDQVDAIEVFKAAFPAGTVSGAPKVRAMEIIDELEPDRRGVYAGAVGLIGFGGDMDFAIAIRTSLIKDGTLHVQAGAGIVADSDPAAEWQETHNKARAVMRAAEMAARGLEQPAGA